MKRFSLHERSRTVREGGRAPVESWEMIDLDLLGGKGPR
jgi:hypothetical protein